jgi:hypothetical protein
MVAYLVYNSQHWLTILSLAKINSARRPRTTKTYCRHSRYGVVDEWGRLQNRVFGGGRMELLELKINPREGPDTEAHGWGADLEQWRPVIPEAAKPILQQPSDENPRNTIERPASRPQTVKQSGREAIR